MIIKGKIGHSNNLLQEEISDVLILQIEWFVSQP